jgi:hypothetical protein
MAFRNILYFLMFCDNMYCRWSSRGRDLELIHFDPAYGILMLKLLFAAELHLGLQRALSRANVSLFVWPDTLFCLV